MRLYSVRDLRKLSDRKRAKLGTLATSRKNKATEPVVAWVSFGPQFKLSRREELIYEHYYPNPTPLLIHDYTTPAGCEESEPTPDKINWGGCQRVPTNVIAEDACLLYCVRTGHHLCLPYDFSRSAPPAETGGHSGSEPSLALD